MNSVGRAHDPGASPAVTEAARLAPTKSPPRAAVPRHT